MIQQLIPSMSFIPFFDLIVVLIISFVIAFFFAKLIGKDWNLKVICMLSGIFMTFFYLSNLVQNPITIVIGIALFAFPIISFSTNREID